jgi:nucleoside-diphosphate-sugar epimerase
MRVLVIGGTRYFGRTLVERLLADGHTVTLYTRGANRPWFWDRVRHIPGDRTDRAAFAAHLAGTSWDLVFDQQAYRREDVEGVLEVLAGRVGRYVLTSTGSVYHDGYVDFQRHCPFAEDTVNHRSFGWDYPPHATEYGTGKRHCEKLLTEHPEFPWTVLRIPAVMGADDPTGRMWFFVQRVLDGGPLLWPVERQAPWRSLFAGDAAASLQRVATHAAARNRIYHVAMEEIMTPHGWISAIARAAGTEARVCFVPAAAIQAVSPDSVPPFSRDTPYLHDLHRSRTEWGYRSTLLDDWLAEVVRWYRHEYQGPDSEGYSLRDEERRLARRYVRAEAALVTELESEARVPQAPS